jgi:hypothetical protein
MDKVPFDPLTTPQPKRNWWLTASIIAITLIVGAMIARAVYKRLAT